MFAVYQRTGDKTKVVLVFENWNLNFPVESHQRDAVPVCAHIIRQKRQLGCDVGTIDLKPAYLQV